VVCSIGIDHVDWLGSTREAIGGEKAGIFRAGRTAVLGSADMPDSVFAVINSLGARALVAGRDFKVHVHDAGWDFQCGDVHLTDLPTPALRGTLQLHNAATALAATAALLGPEFLTLLPKQTVAHALSTTHIRGRFQIVKSADDDLEWVFDVAHNLPAAEALRANLATLPPARTLAVCAVLGDKDIVGITAALAPAIDGWVLAALEGPRAVATRELAAGLPAGAAVLAHAGSVAAACHAARAAARPGDRILVFGSFLTVGPALEFLGI
jgi:dihydrofolate synthase / folylpolyglutamate synthase